MTDYTVEEIAELERSNTELTRTLLLALATVEGACGGAGKLFNGWLRDAKVSEEIITQYRIQ